MAGLLLVNYARILPTPDIDQSQVEDDVVNCETVEDEKCEDVTEGYTTTKRCQKWPRQQCSLEKVVTTKYTTMTGCNKEPTELCAPQGCGFVEVRTAMLDLAHLFSLFVSRAPRSVTTSSRR